MKREEFPRAVFALLFVGLWALLIGTAAALYLNREQIAWWKAELYGALLFVYLAGERRARTRPQEGGERAHEALRYWLALTWWVLTLGSILEYALFPRSLPALTIAGAVLWLAGTALRVWSVRTLGQYYSGHVEAWQGQAVVDSGPYAVIRHPGYAGNMLQAIGMPLTATAPLAGVLALVVVGLFVRRLLWEEDFLREHVPGYDDYMARTWRLIPGIW